MAQQSKVETVPESTQTTLADGLIAKAHPRRVIQVLLRTTSTAPDFAPVVTSHEFVNDEDSSGPQDFTELANLNVADVVASGGYAGALADLKVKHLIEYLALGILMNRGVEEAVDWS